MVCALASAGCGSSPSRPNHDPVRETLPATQSPGDVPKVSNKAPNIVFVLMDDYSLDLVKTMPSMRAMAARGADFTNAFVDDSLCCVSRSSIFTGQYPHQTGVRGNTSNLPNPVGPVGGWPAYEANGNDQRSFAVRLQAAGYTTGFIGKYLNAYELHKGQDPPPVPPGWSDWQVVYGSAYKEWGYFGTRTVGNSVVLQEHPAPRPRAAIRTKDRAYAGNFISRRALAFVKQHEVAGTPYFLEVAPYGVHSRVGVEKAFPNEPRFPATYGDRPNPANPAGNCGLVACASLGVDDMVGYGDPLTDNAPIDPLTGKGSVWNTHPNFLDPATVAKFERQRAQMAQDIDRMMTRLMTAVGPDTYLVLTSDNGYHLGQFGLGIGKGAPYDSDTHVPLYVIGPGVAPGARDGVVSNIDFAATFEALAGIRTPAYRAGHSWVDALRDRATADQGYAFFEHTWAGTLASVVYRQFDPDQTGVLDKTGTIPSYLAVRTPRYLLVRWDEDNSYTGVQYAYELYDYAAAAFEETNVFGRPKYANIQQRLMAKLAAFDACARYVQRDPLPVGCRALTAADSSTRRQLAH